MPGTIAVSATCRLFVWRPDLLKAVLVLPVSHLFVLTAIKALPIQNAQTLTRIDTDAGTSGYGECGTDGNSAPY